jgi:hypothetical protein
MSKKPDYSESCNLHRRSIRKYMRTFKIEEGKEYLELIEQGVFLAGWLDLDPDEEHEQYWHKLAESRHGQSYQFLGKGPRARKNRYAEMEKYTLKVPRPNSSALERLTDRGYMYAVAIAIGKFDSSGNITILSVQASLRDRITRIHKVTKEIETLMLRDWSIFREYRYAQELEFYRNQNRLASPYTQV